ncbi:hypothetical protein SDC9_82813 [bioreactor metagenome]|uniref:Uncharacterized protein n=1 Tax=bioreactor metagenome TaxID=1076179 RepID=A0A644Z7G3_9ZZZZ
MGADIELGEAFKYIGEADYSGIIGGNGHKLAVVAEETHKLEGKNGHDERKQNGDPAGCIDPHAEHPVDGIGIPLAPVLADQNRSPALHPENNQKNYENGDISQRDPRDRGFAGKKAHHKGIQKPQRIGNQILQHNRDGEPHEIGVKCFSTI